ncbi:hypothetical protein RDn1_241 [Candidatus Termititenax dinenymphae]|uniref:Uncharacterized protein n=1 Tax=Candidatus Termititenax dinenymphae TaxID=2218523 RepID=A0A388TKL6_9BACT|nr:hypothetical protein RDn1_241 [Candidatus Termititenax dinenymphae]
MNQAISGMTPFESMQRIAKFALQVYYQHGGTRTLSQIWGEIESLAGRDSISCQIDRDYYNGNTYPIILKKVFTQLDKQFGLKENPQSLMDRFQVTGKEKYDGALDAKRMHYKKIDDIFHDIFPQITGAKSASGDPVLNDEEQETLILMVNALPTIHEIADAPFQHNLDKDNLRLSSMMEEIMFFFKPQRDGSMVNVDTGSVNSGQELIFDGDNTDAAMQDMINFQRLKARVQNRYGQVQPQGCFDSKNLLAFFRVMRRVSEIAAPKSDVPPSMLFGLIFRTLFPYVVATAGMIAVSFIFPTTIPFMIGAFLVTFALSAQKIKDAWTIWSRRKELAAFFMPGFLRKTWDFTKKYTSIEDLRTMIEQLLSGKYYSEQPVTIHGCSPDEEDKKVKQGQKARWFAADKENYFVELLARKLYEKQLKESGLNQKLVVDQMEYFKRAPTDDLFPMSMIFNYHFSLLMSTTLLTGISAFQFAGIVSSFIGGPMLGIAIVGILNLIAFFRVKHQIFTTRDATDGTTLKRARNAESYANMDYSAMSNKLWRLDTSLAKGEFNTTQGNIVAQIESLQSIMLDIIATKKYEAEAKLNNRARIADNSGNVYSKVDVLYWQANNLFIKAAKNMPRIALGLAIASPVIRAVLSLAVVPIFGALPVLTALFSVPVSFALIAFAIISNLMSYSRLQKANNGGVLEVLDPDSFDRNVRWMDEFPTNKAYETAKRQLKFLRKLENTVKKHDEGSPETQKKLNAYKKLFDYEEVESHE